MDANFIPQYAAQAVIDLESQAKVAKRLRDGRHHVLAMLAQMIRDAVHIVLPNRGEIYRPNTGMSSIPTSDECASFDGLPAPVSCFEYPWSYDFKPDSRLVDFGDEANKATKRITLVIDGKQMEASNAEAQRLVGADMDRAVIFSICYMESWRAWLVHDVVLAVKTPIEVSPVTSNFGEWGIVCSVHNVLTFSPLHDDPGARKSFGQMKPDLVAVIQCCHALRAGAFLSEHEEPKASRRWKFQKKGAGGFIYHVLELPAGASAPRAEETGTHAAPRRHIRRAHIRKLPTGVLTFVRQCFVGNLDFGAVEKHYIVKGQQ